MSENSRKGLPLAILGLLALLLLASPAQARGYLDAAPGEIFKTREDRYGHLEYMGYFGSAMRHWNFTAELAPVTNLTWISSRNMDTIIERLRQAELAGVEAVLALEPFLFDSDYRLKPDYLHNLSELQQRIDFEDLGRHIAMLYPVDEPFLRSANSRATNREDMYQALLLVNEDLEALFPGTPLGVIFNHREVFRSDFRIPDSFSWIGMDCYHSLWDCDGRPITDHYRRLLQVMTPEQSLMAVPQAWVKYSDYERGRFEPEELYRQRLQKLVRNLKRRLQHHYEIALAEPRFVAFIPFIWSFDAAPGQPAKPGFGVNRFEEQFPDGGEDFVDLITWIGFQVKEHDHIYPNLNLQRTEPYIFRPGNRYEGGILDVSGGGKISAWSINRALPHKSLRMQTLVFHEGKQVYASSRKRSFILDRELSADDRAELPTLGVHGYRHTLPRQLRDGLRGEAVLIEIRIFGDRSTDYLAIRREHRL